MYVDEQSSELGDDDYLYDEEEEEADEENLFDLILDLAMDHEDDGQYYTRQELAIRVALLADARGERLEENEVDEMVKMYLSLGGLEIRADDSRVAVTDLGYEMAGRTRRMSAAGRQTPTSA